MSQRELYDEIAAELLSVSGVQIDVLEFVRIEDGRIGGVVLPTHIYQQLARWLSAQNPESLNLLFNGSCEKSRAS